MTADEFRQMALDIAGVVEQSHMDHPDFRLNGKIFASLGFPDENWGMVKLSPEEQRSFVAKAPGVFKPCNGAWGRQGCTNVHLESAKGAVLRSAMVAASKNVGPPKAKRKKA